MMPVVMMLGELVFIVALVVGLDMAATARQVFANPIPNIDAAGAGSVLLTQLQSIHATSAWLVPFKFFAVATEFLAIVMGLATIIHILTAQTKMIAHSIDIGREAAKARRVDEKVPA
jgi:hypothetical protein